MTFGKAQLMATTLLAAGLLGSVPALAQTATDVATPQATSTEASAPIIVTGSLLRRKETDGALPITSLSASQLQDRGINTIADALQSLANNNAGALPTSFSANGAFAAGASGASLRGLTTSSTLVLFDGLRAAYYPLADDGTRNFVDLNTIPDAIVDRIEVLKDGASSTYGADAVAGVINIIIKKEIKGFHADVSGGISGKGDAAERRASLTYGYGDLVERGFNVYVNAEYQKNDALLNRDRGFPYNTSDLSSLCGTSVTDGSRTCRTNNVTNGIQADGSFLTPGNPTFATTVPVVRPLDATGMPAGAFQLLNPAAGCGMLRAVTLTPEQQNTDPANPFAAQQCQQDNVAQYGVISPKQERFGATVHLSVQTGDRSKAYALFTYYQNRVESTGTPANVLNITPPAASGVTYDTRPGSSTLLTLPVYVCAARVDCSAANGQLNPNNPFAAAGQTAELHYMLAGQLPDSITFSRTYRGAAGIAGSFGKDWDYTLDLTGMRTDLTQTTTGQIFVQHLLDVVADGSYNFVTPSANSAQIRDYLTPTNVNRSNSQLYQGQASLSHGFFTLPGGDLQIGVGGSVRYESITARSANPDSPQGPTNRYFIINPVGAIGHRTVASAYFEADAPVFKQLDLNVGGRYDHYSSGQSAFSPKFSARFSPIPEIALRGAYSRGFRIPSFAESNGLPTTGFITVNAPSDFQAQHGNNTYGQNYNLGLTTTGTQGLQPEKSRNFTGGVVLTPKPWLSFTVDYFDIKKTNLIVGADYSSAINAYYAGQPVPAGFVVTPDVPDPQFPNAKPRIQFIQYGFVNANSLQINGVDFSASARVPLGHGARLTSTLSGTYVIKYTQNVGGSIQRFDGTLGPYVITSASGTPKWKGNWQTTLDTEHFTLSTTVNYVSGYEGVAEDVGGTRGDCFGSAANTGVPTTFRDGVTPVACRTGSFIDVDMVGTIKVSDRFSLEATILNVFGAKAPYDPTTYGGYQYNPAWANAGIVGRYFRMGAHVNF